MSSETTANAFANSLVPIILSALAVAVSGITFYVNHVRNRKSEQIRICRDIFSNVVPLIREIEELSAKQEGKEKRDYEFEQRVKILSILSEFDYYAYLVIDKEITNDRLLTYHNTKLVEVLKGLRNVISRGYTIPELDKGTIEEKHPYLFKLLETNKKLEEVF